MAFKLYSTSDGRVPPAEYLPCSAITPKAGMAMYMVNGKLCIATGTTVPTYICLAEKGSAVTAGTIIPVTRVEHDMVFETTNSAVLSAAVGDKLTLSSTGMQVTATTTNGVAEIVYFEGTAAGSAVRVRF